MWTESRYPNNAALMARPIAWSIAATACPQPQVWSLAKRRLFSGRDRSSSHAGSLGKGTRLVLSSGGKVTPANGQEHPRTEL